MNLSYSNSFCAMNYLVLRTQYTVRKNAPSIISINLSLKKKCVQRLCHCACARAQRREKHELSVVLEEKKTRELIVLIS